MTLTQNQMKEKESFYKVWKIKTKKEYELNKEAFTRKASSEWWGGEESYLDIDKPQGKYIEPFIMDKRVIEKKEESYIYTIKTKNQTI